MGSFIQVSLDSELTLKTTLSSTMETKTNSYRYSELTSLRKIGNEFWNDLDTILQTGKLVQTDLSPLIKIQKSTNNTLMKVIAKITDEKAEATMSNEVVTENPTQQME